MTDYPLQFLRFLGTSGGRFTMLHQERASGGLWLQSRGSAAVIDPGPGALVQIHRARPQLALEAINALLLTHRHLDHSTDVNVIAEAMTGGGFKNQGAAVLPGDALDESEPILFAYLQRRIRRLLTWENTQPVTLRRDTTVTPHLLIHHGVECYGLIFDLAHGTRLGLISDTRFFPGLPALFAGCTTLIVNVTFSKQKPGYDHLSFDDLGPILEEAAPRLAIATHFGRGALRDNPDELVRRFRKEGREVLAAADGMVVDLESHRRVQ
ncbi:MAG: MBL fold metallo-hydrolase [Synergistales bacterium]|nr:MBL fold metallo-hydrolase [Synergistales bacterium]